MNRPLIRIFLARACRWVQALTFALTLLAAGAVRAECTKDTECKGDRICKEGICTEPDVAPTAAPVVASPPLQPVSVVAAPAAASHRKSNALYYTGMVTTLLGVAALGAGGIVVTLAETSLADRNNEYVASWYPNGGQSCNSIHDVDRMGAIINNCANWHNAIGIGIAVGVTGVVLAAAGLTMFLIGGHQVPASIPAVALVPLLSVSAGSAQLNWVFHF